MKTMKRRTTVAILGAVAALSTVAALAGLAAGGDSPPVLLRDVMLLTPVAAAGSGVAPEVKVRVTIDATGKVAQVDVLGIEPSSEYDDDFRRAAVETIRRWRYAPAREDGQPVEATLEWSVQFLAKEAPERIDVEGLPQLDGGASAALARRARIFTLPLEARKALLKRFVETAEKSLLPGQRRQAESARFVVVTDAANDKTAETLAGNLEATFSVLDGLFADKIEPQPERYKVIAFVFQQRSSFETVLAAIDAEGGWQSGFYAAPGFLAFNLEVGDVDYLLHLMIHEATHAYTDRYLTRPGYSLPLWLEEGFGEYLGTSEIKKGALVPGRIVHGRFVLNRWGGARVRRSEAAYGLEDIRRAMRTGEGLTVEQIMSADRAVFYGEKREIYYPMSWLLVHFLRHGRPEWAEGAFPDFMLYLAEGYPAKDALAATYGATPADLEAEFRAYPKGL